VLGSRRQTRYGKVFGQDFRYADPDQRGRHFIYGELGDGIPGVAFVWEAQAVSVKRGMDFGFGKFRGRMSIWTPRWRSVLHRGVG
jgi:hypothetical protein